MALIRDHHGISPRIHPSAFIAENAVIIGDVEIGAHASVWYGCVLRGDLNAIRIGAGTNIQDGTVIHVAADRPGQTPYPTIVGADVTVGHMALLHACTVGDDGFVGMKACLLDGSKIEASGMLAAGALLTPGKVVPSGELWGGSPARFMRTLGPDQDRSFKESAAHYVQLAKSYAK
jgi:carbonic anhydrase/acetyltransferase-like protein (isoleucine patch superfamily)